MSVPSQILTHKEDAKALLISQFRGKLKISGILETWVGPFQELEDVLWSVLNAFDPATAINDQLNQVGAMVGEARLGRTDAEYRDAIFLRILINKSQGRSNDVITIVKKLWPNFYYYENGRAAFQVWTYATPLAKIGPLSMGIRQTRPAGVKAHYLIGTLSFFNYVIPSSTAGGSAFGRGSGSVTAPSLIRCRPHVRALT